MSCLQLFDIAPRRVFTLMDSKLFWAVEEFMCDEGYYWHNLYEYSGLNGIQLNKPYFVESTPEMPLFKVTFQGSNYLMTTKELLVVEMNEIGFERYYGFHLDYLFSKFPTLI